jgi:hypothetical protein
MSCRAPQLNSFSTKYDLVFDDNDERREATSSDRAAEVKKSKKHKKYRSRSDSDSGGESSRHRKQRDEEVEEKKHRKYDRQSDSSYDDQRHKKHKSQPDDPGKGTSRPQPSDYRRRSRSASPKDRHKVGDDLYELVYFVPRQIAVGAILCLSSCVLRGVRVIN